MVVFLFSLFSKGQEKHAPPPGPIFNPYGSPMRFDDSLGNCQPEPYPLTMGSLPLS